MYVQLLHILSDMSCHPFFFDSSPSKVTLLSICHWCRKLGDILDFSLSHVNQQGLQILPKEHFPPVTITSTCHPSEAPCISSRLSIPTLFSTVPLFNTKSLPLLFFTSSYRNFRCDLLGQREKLIENFWVNRKYWYMWPKVPLLRFLSEPVL